MRLVGARSAGLVTEAPHFVTAHEPAVVDASARIASAHGVTSGQVNGTSVPVIVLDSPRLCITYEEEMEPAALDQRRKHSVHRCLLTAAITKADSCNVPLLMSASWRQVMLSMGLTGKILRDVVLSLPAGQGVWEGSDSLALENGRSHDWPVLGSAVDTRRSDWLLLEEAHVV